MAKATQLAKIDSSIKISNGLERKVRRQGTKRRRMETKKATCKLKLVKAPRDAASFSLLSYN